MRTLSIAENALPLDFQEDLAKVRSLLLGHDAGRIILYGSLARGDYRPDSDIDLCVEGLPDRNFFRALAECLMNARQHFRVLDFKNARGYLRDRILNEGRLLHERQ